MESNPRKPSNFPSLLKYIGHIEERITRLEEHLNLVPLKYIELDEEVKISSKTGANEDIEFQIGRFWFAKGGVVAVISSVAATCAVTAMSPVSAR